MKRLIIRIDESKCDGCGKCVTGCHEGALQVIDGKARLVNEAFCDGLGACIGECPRGAITLETREAEARAKAEAPTREKGTLPCGCPGTFARTIDHDENADAAAPTGEVRGELRQWPVQLRLLNPSAPCFKGADLLVTADCVPFAYGDFHRRFLKGKIVIMFCPKLDPDKEEYVEKLAEIFRLGKPRSVTVVRMEVPCCGGMETIVRRALAMSGESLAVDVHIVGIDGKTIS